MGLEESCGDELLVVVAVEEYDHVAESFDGDRYRVTVPNDIEGDWEGRESEPSAVKVRDALLDMVSTEEEINVDSV